MIINGSMPDRPGKRKKRKPMMGIPDAHRARKRKPTIGIPDAPKKPIPNGATPVTPSAPRILDGTPSKTTPSKPRIMDGTPNKTVPSKPRVLDGTPSKTIPSGSKPVKVPGAAMPDRPRRRKPVNPNDPNLQKMNPTGALNSTMTGTAEALKPNEGTSTMQAAANIASQLKKRVIRKSI
jgi:hypothetical protein